MCVAVPVSAETRPSARIFLHSYDFAVFRTFLGNRGERSLLVKSDTLGVGAGGSFTFAAPLNGAFTNRNRRILRSTPSNDFKDADLCTT